MPSNHARAFLPVSIQIHRLVRYIGCGTRVEVASMITSILLPSEDEKTPLSRVRGQCPDEALLRQGIRRLTKGVTGVAMASPVAFCVAKE
jgi:hypothetical protein